MLALVSGVSKRLLDPARDKLAANGVSETQHTRKGLVKALLCGLCILYLNASALLGIHNQSLLEHRRLAVGGNHVLPQVLGTNAKVPQLVAKANEGKITAINKISAVRRPLELDGPEVTLGRDPKNTVFLNDMTVSRHHARMNIANISAGLATIEDLGSLNGTWVDGAFATRASLRDGSTIQIGTFRMVFHTNSRPRRIDVEA